MRIKNEKNGVAMTNQTKKEFCKFQMNR